MKRTEAKQVFAGVGAVVTILAGVVAAVLVSLTSRKTTRGKHHTTGAVTVKLVVAFPSIFSLLRL